MKFIPPPLAQIVGAYKKPSLQVIPQFCSQLRTIYCSLSETYIVPNKSCPKESTRLLIIEDKPS